MKRQRGLSTPKRRLKIAVDIVVGVAFLAFSASLLNRTLSGAAFFALIGLIWLALAGHDSGLFQARGRAFVALTGLIFGGLSAAVLYDAFTDEGSPAWRGVGFLGAALLTVICVLCLYGFVRGPRVRR
jgi:peptidoglycan/LPS O-acetylase OafA/YrhL